MLGVTASCAGQGDRPSQLMGEEVTAGREERMEVLDGQEPSIPVGSRPF